MRTRVGLLLGMLALSVGLAGCQSDEAASGPGPRPMTPDQLQEVLAQEGPAGDGRFPGGTFTFGTPFDNSDSPFGDTGMAGGRLASASWDIYWHSSDGDRGAWGAGIDVLRTPARAARALREDAGFWCPGPKRAVRNLGDGGLAEVRASTCHRAGGDGFYATYDAADGPVLADLTVGGPTRRAAVAALRAVWPSIRDAVVRIRDAQG
jgi:hypothetical protein